MRPAPIPNDDETDFGEDARVADPLSDNMLNLWNTTARVNREVFTELFRPIPSNLVTNWAAYEVRHTPLGMHGLAKWAFFMPDI
jgi:phospholipase D1/2